MKVVFYISIAAVLAFVPGCGKKRDDSPRLANIPPAMFLIFVATVHAPRVAHDLHDGHQWANLLVPVCLSGAALILAEVFPPP